MRFLNLLSKPDKQIPADSDSINARLLVQAGFVRQEMAGVYSWLPLGLRVLIKIESIIREELDSLGAQEILMPALQPKKNWVKTGRWDSLNVLFKVSSQTKKEYALGPTHEEIVTPLIGSYLHSYKDLPLSVYQIQTKFRDELRAKSGVLRGREFSMKDMYSFHASQDDLDRYYELVKQSYFKIFSRCGLDAKIVEASGGSFSKKISHEFHVITPAGEDDIIACSKCNFAQNMEITTLNETTVCSKCGSKLEAVKGVEIGNIFQLDTKFTDVFDVKFTDADGSRKLAIMGCYGIGVTRLVGAVVEARHDARGMIWPKSIAPYDVHLMSLSSKNPEKQERIQSISQDIYENCAKHGLSVLFDDRIDTSVGVKFADADLIGIPTRILVSQKSLDQGGVEVRERGEEKTEIVQLDQMFDKIRTKKAFIL